MVVSFRIKNKQKKTKPMAVIFECSDDSTNECNGRDEDEAAVDFTGPSTSAGRVHTTGEDEVSFVLNLHKDGYSIVNPSEDDLELIRPYDRTSADLFEAIESGMLPSGVLDDFPCKFVKGAITCEIRDYRKCIPDPGSMIYSHGQSATISKVRLKMSLKDVVRDISLMADDSWTYGDFMEVESRIINALQPNLFLDPVPRFDRLCQNPDSLKIDFGLAGLRKRRLQQTPEFTVSSDNQPYGKKICSEQAPIASYVDVMSPHGRDNTFSHGSANPTPVHDPGQGYILLPETSFADQDMPLSFVDNMNSTVSETVIGQEGQLSPYSTFDDRARFGPGDPDDIQLQHIDLFVDEFQKEGPSMVNADLQLTEAERSHMDPQAHQRCQSPLTRPANHQAGWNNVKQKTKTDPNEEEFSNTKSIQSPRLSVAAAVSQSPLSVRPAEMSAGSTGAHYEAVSTTATFGQAVREKSGVTASANSFLMNPEVNGEDSLFIMDTMDDPGSSSVLFVSTQQVTDCNMIERFAKIKMVAMRRQLNSKRNKADEFPRKHRTFSAQGLPSCLFETGYECDDESMELSKSLIGGHVNECKTRVLSFLSHGQGNMIPAPVGARMILSTKPDNCTVTMHYGELNDEDYLKAEDYLPTLPNTHYADLLVKQFCALIIREGCIIEEVIQPSLDRPSDCQSNASGNGPKTSAIETYQLPSISAMLINDYQVSRLHSFSESVFQSTEQSDFKVRNNLIASALPTSGMDPPKSTHTSQGNMPDVAKPARQKQMDAQQPLQQPPNHNQPSMIQQVSTQLQGSQLMPQNSSMTQLNTFERGSNLPVSNQMGNKTSQQPVQQLQHHNQPSMMQQVRPQFQQSQLIPPNNLMPQLNTFGPGSNLPVSNQMMGNNTFQLPVQQLPHQIQPCTMQQVVPQFQQSQRMPVNNSMPQMNTFQPGSNLPVSNPMVNGILQQPVQQPVQQGPHQYQPSMMQQVPPQFQSSQLMPRNNVTPQMNAFEPGSNLPVKNQMAAVQQTHHQNQPSMMQQVPPQFQRSQLMPRNNITPQMNAFEPGSNLPVKNQMAAVQQQTHHQNQPSMMQQVPPQFQRSQIMPRNNITPQMNAFEPGSNLPVKNQMAAVQQQTHHQNQPSMMQQVPPQFQRSQLMPRNNITPQMNAFEPGSNLPVKNQMAAVQQTHHQNQPSMMQQVPPQFQRPQLMPRNNITPQMNAFEPGSNLPVKNQMTAIQQTHHQNQPSMMQQVPPQFQRSQLMPRNNITPQMNAFEPGSNLPVKNQMASVQQTHHQNQPSMMQQVPPQFQRSQLMPVNNLTPQMNAFEPGSNLPISNHIDNKTVQPAQPSQTQGNMRMTDIGTAMGMANYGKNMDLGRLGAAGIPAATGSISGMNGNMSQNTIGLNRAGTVSPQASFPAQRLGNMQNRGMLGGHQSGIGGGASQQMQPRSSGLSMVGQSLDRGNIGYMQQTAMGQTQMGMQNLMPGMNVPLNQQQLQPPQHQQQLRQPISQQQAMSPFQGVLPPQQVSSPSAYGFPRQMNPQYAAQQHGVPQQMAQQTPMNQPLMPGPLHQTTGGNQDVYSANQALNSQTPGSVGGMPNSSVGFQGFN